MSRRSLESECPEVRVATSRPRDYYRRGCLRARLVRGAAREDAAVPEVERVYVIRSGDPAVRPDAEHVIWFSHPNELRSLLRNFIGREQSLCLEPGFFAASALRKLEGG